MTGRERRSLKLSTQGRKQAEQALLNLGSQTDLAAQLEMSRTTVSKFFAGKKPLLPKTFHKICKKLKLTWQEVADLPKDVAPAPDEQEQNKGDDIDTLVQKVRALCYDKIQHQCGTIQLLDVSHPVELDNLYVDVNILEDIPSQRWSDISKRLQEFDPSADEFDRFYLGEVRQPRVPGLQAAKNHKLMVLGQPGSGKTTFLKHLAIECNKGNFQAERVPIFIGLKRFTDIARKNLLGLMHSLPLREYISQELQLCDVAAADVESLLKSGRALLLLDGLDEVSEQDSESEAVQQQITWICDRYYKNQFVITCRTQAQKYRFEGFAYVEVADFNQEQIKAFANKWFVTVARNSEEKGLVRAADFVEKLEQPENNRIRELAVTPILLSLTCLVFEHLKDFPPNRAELYEQGLNILLTRWDEEVKGIQRVEVYQNLLLPHKIKLLTQVAAITFGQNDYFFEKDKIQKIIADYLRTLSSSKTDSDELQLDSEAVLRAIETQHGLLIERARGIYSFSHLTFQEYFTAKNFVVSSDAKKLKEVVIHVTDTRWREVFLLASNMDWNINNILLLRNQINGLLASDKKLQQLLNWINLKTLLVHVRCRKAAIRAFYFAIILARALERDLDCDLSHALDHSFAYDGVACKVKSFEHDFELSLDLDLFLALDRAYALDRVFSYPIDSELRHLLQQLNAQRPKPYDEYAKRVKTWWKANSQAWTEQLRALMIKYRNIGHNWQFSKRQKKLIRQYYDANLFLVDCLHSNCKVTKEVQQEIEDTLLLPIAEME